MTIVVCIPYSIQSCMMFTWWSSWRHKLRFTGKEWACNFLKRKSSSQGPEAGRIVHNCLLQFVSKYCDCRWWSRYIDRRNIHVGLRRFFQHNLLSMMFFGLGELAQRSIDLLFMYSVPALYIRGSGFLLYGETLFYRYIYLDSAHVLLWSDMHTQ